MVNSKIKKTLGAFAFATALLVSAIPTNAAEEFEWVVDRYKDGSSFYLFKDSSGQAYVKVYFTYKDPITVKCDTMLEGRCYVRK
ncbi:hypothetical protein [Bacillus cereus]|uniref:hypothetical protein n=1 Tax=Bacillus cereus TaxID=1396 RepID=UPI00119E9AFF|nr:hypothetical protein [Bacillus cereus]HDR4686631.1 hypothetical protein [Bacillus cereus]